MLFIYSALPLGGIETFYLRMAKARHKAGKRTKILLTSGVKFSNEGLLREARKYADVYFLEEFLRLKVLKSLTLHFLLLKPLDYKRLSSIFEGVDHVHVSSAIYGLFALKLFKHSHVLLPLTIGIYHSKEFIWGGDDSMPFYERCNRALFRDLLSKKAVCFFNEKLPVTYAKYYDVSSSAGNVFPLGVVFSTECQNAERPIDAPTRIVSVGRLVSFKAYNLWMLDVLSRLKNESKFEYHIFGDGPLLQDIQNKVKELGLESAVCIKGSLPYDQFKNTVASADIFVGSGTAIVEASSIGVPSIVGIDSVSVPVSYGFICDIEGFSYNEDGLYDKCDVEPLIRKYLRMSKLERSHLRQRHISWAGRFSMEVCVANFEKVGAAAQKSCGYKSDLVFRLKYTFSFIMFSLLCRLSNKSLSEKVYG